MSQIKIYGLKDSLKSHQTNLSDAIHRAVVEALAYPVDKKFHRFIDLEQSEFIFPADRSPINTPSLKSLCLRADLLKPKNLLSNYYFNILSKILALPLKMSKSRSLKPQNTTGAFGGNAAMN